LRKNTTAPPEVFCEARAHSSSVYLGAINWVNQAISGRPFLAAPAQRLRLKTAADGTPDGFARIAYTAR